MVKIILFLCVITKCFLAVASNGSCGENEIYQPCRKTSSPQRCENIGKAHKYELAISQKPPKPCKGSCVCKTGYVRNIKNECISKEDASKCNGPYEYFSCGGACDNVCADLHVQNQTNCPIVNIKCNPMCYCESEYARDSNNICVPTDACQKNCGSNEVYEPCQESTSPQACDRTGKEGNRLRGTSRKIPKSCEGSCVCKPGFVRNKISECISKEDASKCHGPYEYFSCGGACDNVCANLHTQNQTNCPIVNIKCNPMCYCESGYARNSNSICVPIDDCEKKCTGPHEYFNCGGACDNVCANLHIQNQTHCPIVNIKCNPMCYCESGYARDSSNTCVPIDDCEKKCTGPHEYFDCGGACDNVCANLHIQNQTHCPIVNIKCNPMCYCESGYARDSNNICVLVDDCETKVPQPSENEHEGLAKGLTMFSMKIFYELVKDNTEMNYIMSALSLLFPLSLFALYTTGPSNVQLLAALHARDKEEIRKSVPVYSQQMAQYDQLILASGIFVDKIFELNNTFVEESQAIIKASPQNVDFRKPTQAAELINSFVASKTNGTITNMVEADMIDEMTRLILINTIFFKANWTSQFNERNTKQRYFYINNNRSIQIDFMNKRGNIRYGECSNLDVKAIELPYTGENFKFVLFLPNNNGSEALLNLLTKLYKDIDMMRNCLESLSVTPLDLYLPKFKIDTRVNLVELLEKLNVTLIFDSIKSGITGISKENQDLYVSDAFQKSFIIVSERGSEAGAANAFEIGVRSLPLPPIEYTVFEANRPFMFLIKHNDTILFSGLKVR